MRTKTLLTGLLAVTLLVSTTSFSFLGSQDDEPTPPALDGLLESSLGERKALEVAKPGGSRTSGL